MNYIVLNHTENFKDKIKLNHFKKVTNENERVDAVFGEINKVILDDLDKHEKRREGLLSEPWLLRDGGVRFILCKISENILHDESGTLIKKLIELYDKESFYIEIRSYHDSQTYNQIECYIFAYNKQFGFRDNIFPEKIDGNILETLCKCIENEFF